MNAYESLLKSVNELHKTHCVPVGTQLLYEFGIGDFRIDRLLICSCGFSTSMIPKANAAFVRDEHLRKVVLKLMAYHQLDIRIDVPDDGH